ncbi:MAG: hypothetical protein DRN83_01330 [Hadesarchaea archaeon]|nr:MAG: hypothetical protein DRN83_01330 [Hadesarchaea archaeon]HDI12632.1 DNA replication complex GINS family protein [Hadesarchaea archaeon]
MTDFSLEELWKIYKEEKTSRDLVELPEDFYQTVARYISHLTSEFEREDGLKRDLILEELKNITFMVQEVHLTRVSKVIQRVHRSSLPSVLLERERYAFSEIQKSLERLQADLVYSAVAGKLSSKEPIELTTVLLVMLTHVPEKIIGADMKEYGPFLRGEICNLPVENAEMMVRRRMAKKISVRMS